uniref:Uncharacterized protein n=1 Tax=Romanomermis culicivorax TaxID=13658 RepID=A0A915HV41_ROMCU
MMCLPNEFFAFVSCLMYMTENSSIKYETSVTTRVIIYHIKPGMFRSSKSETLDSSYDRKQESTN